jgi:hypothetical protein
VPESRLASGTQIKAAGSGAEAIRGHTLEVKNCAVRHISTARPEISKQ